ncbi:MAG TPA: hypothetical protein VLI88_02310 [Patescibacteria group bacterium]|nr:hypothetical protein [Patescibacteria group bacterium]
MPTEVWLPLLTLILGYVGSLLTESRRDARLAQREEKARTDARALASADRRDEFQRKTLLELQEALMVVARITAEMHSEDRRGFKATGQWTGGLHSEGLDQRGQAANGVLSTIAVRVLDDRLRATVDEFHKAATHAAVIARTREEAVEAMSVMTNSMVRANERIGELLRSLY